MEKLKIACKVCGKPINKYSKKYCSRKCMGIDRLGSRNVWYGKKSPNAHRKNKVIGVPVGTIIKEKDTGYLRIKTGCKKWIRHHRFVMQEHLGRKLKKEEVVHHKNGIRNDNRLINLAIMTNREHKLLHLEGSGDAL